MILIGLSHGRALVLDLKNSLSDICAICEKGFGQAHAWIEVQVVKRHRILKNVPECLLGIKQV